MSNEIAKPETKAVAKSNRKNEIRHLLTSDEFKREVANALPQHLTPDRFIRVALTAMTRTPDLAKCTQASFFRCLLDLSAMGIEPDGRRAHLIPYRNNKLGVTECTLIVDYKGLVELVMRSGLVSNIHADVVCENDVFEYDMGQIKKHVINFREPRGKVYAAYATCTFKDGTYKSEVMSAEEIEKIRKRSRAGNTGPWVSDWNEMAKKTPTRRLVKWLPLSPEFRDAIEREDAQEAVHIAPCRDLPTSLDTLCADLEESNALDSPPFDDIPVDADGVVIPE